MMMPVEDIGYAEFSGNEAEGVGVLASCCVGGEGCLVFAVAMAGVG